jgi:hypothetical protein
VVDVAEQVDEARFERQLIDDAFRALLLGTFGLVVFLVIGVDGHGCSFNTDAQFRTTRARCAR